MGDEEQARACWGVRRQASVIEGGDHGLARSGRRNKQIPVPAVNDALDLELVEHLLLVGVRAYLEAREGQRYPVAKAFAGCFGEGVVQPVAVRRGVVRLERRVVPIAVERGEELLQQGRRRHGRKPNIPLDAIEHRGPGQIARPDVCRVESGPTSEEPRLGVQPGSLRVVLDFDLCTQVVDEAIQGRALGGAHVGRCDDANRDTSVSQRDELVFEDPKSVPLDEGHDDVDAVGASQFGADFMPDPRLTRSIGKQRCIGQRRRRTLPEDAHDGARRGRHRNGEQLPSGGEGLLP